MLLKQVQFDYGAIQLVNWSICKHRTALQACSHYALRLRFEGALKYVKAQWKALDQLYWRENMQHSASPQSIIIIICDQSNSRCMRPHHYSIKHIPPLINLPTRAHSDVIKGWADAQTKILMKFIPSRKKVAPVKVWHLLCPPEELFDFRECQMKSRGM